MKILVTGAGGHLGSVLIGMLSEAGHEVRGSLRTVADPQAVQRLKVLGASEVVAAPLESGEALRAAMQGMDTLIHTAAVYLLHAPGRDEEIVSASLDGVERALKAAKDAGIGRVVLTSSIVTLPLRPAGSPPATETDWASDLRVPYFRAKTLAEKKAWQLAGELGLDLVSILPGAFAGPGFQRQTPTVDLVDAIMKGAMDVAAPRIAYPYVDVRDVARAHLLALEPRAKGRYIAINEPIPTLADIARLMHEIDPAIPAPKFDLPHFTLPVLPLLEAANSWISGAPRTFTGAMAATMRGRAFQISSRRIRDELGWSPSVSLRQSLADTIAAVRAPSFRGQASAAAGRQ